jgi:hypothetical protein
MLPYWLLFLITSTGALTMQPHSASRARLGVLVVAAIALTFFIGYRFRVGGDWDTYDFMFVSIMRSPFAAAMTQAEPSFALLNWVVGELGGQVWHVNLICAAIFVYALIRFCSTLPLPLVGAVAAVPIFIIVLAMGFTRQATALSCIMLAAASFRGRFSAGWIVWLAVAVTFHRSAIFAIPIFFTASSHYRLLNLALGVLIGLVLVTNFILGSLDQLLAVYLESGLESGGASIRVAICVGLAIVYFIALNRRELMGERYFLWRNMGLTALLLVPAYFLTSSTIVDRLAYLILPFQLMVQSYLPVALTRQGASALPMIFVVILFNAGVLGGWLFYADHSINWVPYQNVLTEPYPY